MTRNTGTYALQFTKALEFPVGSPLGLLAAAVIGYAVQDARNGREVILAQSWLDLADVDTRWLERAGVKVDSSIRLRWQFG